MNDSESITVYTIESLVQLTGVPHRDIRLYCENGLIRPAASREGEHLFDDEAVYRLRRIEFLRQERGVSLEGIQIIFELTNEVHRLREEMRFLRS
jgi:MerR family transcriptional regulator, heat shock protein HspR